MCITIQTPDISDQRNFTDNTLNKVTGLCLCLACVYLGYASERAAEQRSALGLARQAQWPRLQPGAHTTDPLFPLGPCHPGDAAAGQATPQAAGRRVHHHADDGQVHRHAAAGQVHCLADNRQVAPGE